MLVYDRAEDLSMGVGEAEEINDWLRGKTVSGQTNAVRVSETHTCNGMGCDES